MGDQSSVKMSVVQQVRVCAGFNNPAVFENDNYVRVPYGRKTVGNNDGGSVGF